MKLAVLDIWLAYMVQHKCGIRALAHQFGDAGQLLMGDAKIEGKAILCQHLDPLEKSRLEAKVQGFILEIAPDPLDARTQRYQAFQVGTNCWALFQRGGGDNGLETRLVLSNAVDPARVKGCRCWRDSRLRKA